MTYYSRKIQALGKTLYRRKSIIERIIGAKRFIDRHYGDSINLDSVCNEAHVSKYHFIRLFKTYYGRTPHQYLMEVRIAKAKELISHGMTVRGACFAVGYDSMTSFSALFKKVTGQAPLRIRQNSNFRYTQP